MKPAGVGIADDASVSFGGKVREISEHSGDAAAEFIDRGHVVFKSDGGVFYVGSVNFQKALCVLSACSADGNVFTGHENHSFEIF